MDDLWTQLVRYKLAEDKLNELKKKVWENLPFDADTKVTMEAAEKELEELKNFIELNGPISKMD